jgi:hypothetical protein
MFEPGKRPRLGLTAQAIAALPTTVLGMFFAGLGRFWALAPSREILHIKGSTVKGSTVLLKSETQSELELPRSAGAGRTVVDQRGDAAKGRERRDVDDSQDSK